jgi:cob(I)alamin adenosyltransferase
MDEKELTTAFQEHISSEAARLDRIEDKIDKLAETVISLARAEEKLIALSADNQDTRARLRGVEEAVVNVDRKVDETAVTVKVINRLFWILVAAAAAAVIGQYLT